MSTVTAYTKIADGSPATPSLFNSRMSLLQQNIDTLNSDKLEGVTTSDIDDLSVTNAKLASNAVSAAKIIDNAITGEKINTSSVVTVAKLATTTGLKTARLYYPGSSNFFSLNLNSNGAVDVSHLIGAVSTGETLITSRRRLSITASGGGDTAPTSGDDTGTPGEVAFDSDYLYLCTSVSSWRRVALDTF